MLAKALVDHSIIVAIVGFIIQVWTLRGARTTVQRLLQVGAALAFVASVVLVPEWRAALGMVLICLALHFISAALAPRAAVIPPPQARPRMPAKLAVAVCVLLAALVLCGWATWAKAVTVGLPDCEDINGVPVLFTATKRFRLQFRAPIDGWYLVRITPDLPLDEPFRTLYKGAWRPITQGNSRSGNIALVADALCQEVQLRGFNERSAKSYFESKMQALPDPDRGAEAFWRSVRADGNVIYYHANAGDDLTFAAPTPPLKGARARVYTVDILVGLGTVPGEGGDVRLWITRGKQFRVMSGGGKEE